jgi:hypothetical protein
MSRKIRSGVALVALALLVTAGFVAVDGIAQARAGAEYDTILSAVIVLNALGLALTLFTFNVVTHALRGE